MQLHVLNSPFNEEQVELLNQLIPTLTTSQKIWLTGFLTAAPHLEGEEQLTPTSSLQNTIAISEAHVQHSPVEVGARTITILYGTDTGNSQGLANAFGDKLEKQGFKVTVANMEDFKPKEIKKVQDLLIVTSTDGDGDPPDNALSFHEYLHGKKAPKLEDVRFSVLALGDTSYEFFCQTGKEFDEVLEKLGGERVYPRIDCDLDFEEPAADWFEGVLAKLNETKNAVNGVGPVNSVSAIQEMDPTGMIYTKTNPFKAEVLENLVLNGRGSNKETRHLELDLEDSNLTFEPGDSLGIIPENDELLVNELIDEMGWNPDDLIEINKQGDLLSVREALTSYFEITLLTKPLLEKAAVLTNNEDLKKLVESGDRDQINQYLEGRDLLDLLRDFGPWEVSAKDILGILRKIPGRLYSIASSWRANPDEVHLTVGTVSYHAYGRDRKGVASGMISEKIEVGDKLSVYIQKNDSFRLPENPDTPVIMIGPGTGVAPFRSFLEEREEIEAQGDTWLFFGDQHFKTDFLYQTEWQKWLADGVLTRIDVAFSRDTPEKVYVQHRMLKHSADFYQWLEKGAHVYVCGDEKSMAKDVHQAILTILQKEGNMSEEEAQNYIADLRQQKRYHRDVY